MICNYCGRDLDEYPHSWTQCSLTGKKEFKDYGKGYPMSEDDMEMSWEQYEKKKDKEKSK